MEYPRPRMHGKYRAFPHCPATPYTHLQFAPQTRHLRCRCVQPIQGILVLPCGPSSDGSEGCTAGSGAPRCGNSGDGRGSLALRQGALQCIGDTRRRPILRGGMNGDLGGSHCI